MSLDPALAAGAVASAGDAIVPGDGTGTTTSWNHSAERLLGYSCADAVGQTLALIIAAGYRIRHRAGVAAVLRPLGAAVLDFVPAGGA
jgi:PAS domain S-box-containing protein